MVGTVALTCVLSRGERILTSTLLGRSIDRPTDPSAGYFRDAQTKVAANAKEFFPNMPTC